ncbi:MAG: nickel-responsive transcriptional regulator NikR [Synergistaceae bacterium]|jgi:CopG family nickel-responsive transcriptional regulator|nr:nickel-responsive transcriptional regulator NikR [Synergistaceae bacterium]
MTGKLARFGVAVPQEIVDEFDQHLRQSGKSNRSDVLRQLMRSFISEERWRDETGEVYGTITMMYGHHQFSTTNKELTLAQHDHGDVIVCSTHVHITHDTCMECIVLRGESQKIKMLVDALGKIRGVKNISTSIFAGV